MQDRDEQLLLLVIAARQELPGRLVAFEQLCVAVYATVRNLARGITGNPDVADSVTQEVLIRMMHGLPKLEEPERFFGWLRKITVNVSNTWLTKELREREKRDRFAEQPAQVIGLAEPSVTFDEMVRSLSVDDKAVVCLKILDDLEFQDIAEVTGLSLSAVKMRYYRALEKVRDGIDEPQ